MIDPRKSYWSEMPLRIKVLAPFTAILIAAGALLYERGYDEGLIVAGVPLLIIGIRFVLFTKLDIGVQTILGYTYDYWTEKAEATYRLPQGSITITLTVLFIVAVVIWSSFAS